MKLTKKDFDEVLNHAARADVGHFDGDAEAFIKMLKATKLFDQLQTMLVMTIVVRAMGKGADLSQAMLGLAEIAATAGAVLGYQLGLREAALEMGITTTSEAVKEVE